MLLLLAKAPERRWTAAEIRSELRLPTTALPPKSLTDLEHAGLLGCEDGTPPRYAYAPRTPELRAGVEALAVAYNERPVTLVRAIYERPSPIQSFADAFRLRQDES